MRETAPNKALEPTAYSGGSPRAFGSRIINDKTIRNLHTKAAILKIVSVPESHKGKRDTPQFLMSEWE
jgi:hypothetical protein